MEVEKYNINYCSNNNWETDQEGNYVDVNIHYEINEEDIVFDTEKEAIKWVKQNEEKLDLFYIRINKIFITIDRFGREEYEIDESYDPIFLEDLTK